MPTEHDTTDHLHDRGLAFDLATLVNRRRALKLFAGAAFVGLAACADKRPVDTTSAASTSTTGAGATSAGASTVDCATPIPEETAGPYPGDGSNGPNVLTDSGVVRRDITTSFGGSSGTAAGVPLTIDLTIVDTDGCTPIEGAAVYLWHCDREGRYSLYSSGITDQNYLRGVQVADGNGKLSFTSIFPAAYSGRWPHIHFEVYPALAEAKKAGTPRATSQLALPESVCSTVYATEGYTASGRNLARMTLQTDMVFRDDGATHQLATVTGTVAGGYVASLVVPV